MTEHREFRITRNDEAEENCSKRIAKKRNFSGVRAKSYSINTKSEPRTAAFIPSISDLPA
jgi:hypothetical protein